MEDTEKTLIEAKKTIEALCLNNRVNIVVDANGSIKIVAVRVGKNKIRHESEIKLSIVPF